MLDICRVYATKGAPGRPLLTRASEGQREGFRWADGAFKRRAGIRVAAGLLGALWDDYGPRRHAEVTESADAPEHVVQAPARALLIGGGGSRSLLEPQEK